MAKQTGDSGNRTADGDRTVGWGFWLWWVLASTVGWLIGPNLGTTLVISGVSLVPTLARAGTVFQTIVSLVFPIIIPVISALLGGALLGAMHLLVLRRQVHGAGWWVVATGLGWVIGGVVVGVPLSQMLFSGLDASRNDNGTLSQFVSLVFFLARSEVFYGAVLGVCQWLVLRRQVARAGWWVAASTAGWTLGAAMPWIWERNPIGLLSPILGGIAYGAISGLVLVWLLRRHVPGAER